MNIIIIYSNLLFISNVMKIIDLQWS